MNFPSTSVFIVGLVTGILIGIVLGIIIARRSKKPESRVTAVQLLSVIVFFGYIALCFAFVKEVSWIIAIAILTTGYGAKGGEVIEKALERAESLSTKPGGKL